MLKRQFIIALLLVCGNVSTFAKSPKWTEISSDDTSVMYVNRNVTSSGKHKVKIWSMIDYRNQIDGTKYSYSSELMLDEYDCRKQLVRAVFGAYKTDHMGKGKTPMSNTSPLQWLPIEPDSWIKTEWELACKRTFELKSCEQ